jgi:hypothetical protein
MLMAAAGWLSQPVSKGTPLLPRWRSWLFGDVRKIFLKRGGTLKKRQIQVNYRPLFNSISRVAGPDFSLLRTRVSRQGKGLFSYPLPVRSFEEHGS